MGRTEKEARDRPPWKTRHEPRPPVKEEKGGRKSIAQLLREEESD